MSSVKTLATPLLKVNLPVRQSLNHAGCWGHSLASAVKGAHSSSRLASPIAIAVLGGNISIHVNSIDQA